MIHEGCRLVQKVEMTEGRTNKKKGYERKRNAYVVKKKCTVKVPGHRLYLHSCLERERTVQMDYGECDAGYTLYGCTVRMVLYIHQSEMSSCLKQGLWLDIMFFLD